jgi:phage/plasmid-associated DNA primase
MINLSEESSGYEVSYEEANIIKTLSAGGSLFVERKGQDGFDLRNKAKLIFSTNKAPIFRDQGLAIKRRMLVVPFEHKIEKIDSRVGARLVAEAPKILSMLSRRLKENVVKNQGRFVVNRGGGTTEKARRRMLGTSSTPARWARERIVSSVELGKQTWVLCSELYADYLSWCEQEGIKNPVNKLTFSKHLFEYSLSPASQSSVVWAGDKNTRAVTFCRFRQEGDEVEDHE